MAVLDPEQRSRVIRLREEGFSLAVIAVSTGLPPLLVSVVQPEQRRVSNERLREGLLTGLSSANEIALNLGWYCGRRSPKPDTGRVKRVLGVNENITRKKGKTYRTRASDIDLDLFLMIGQIMGLDPWELEV